MAISGVSGLDTYEVHATTIDASKEGYATDPVSIGDHSQVSLFVSSVSGSHAKHVVMLQISPDGKRWFDTEHSITGTGYISVSTILASEVRAIIAIGESTTSKADIDIISR